MNIKEYISSGIVESYVLGLASGEERSEFEQLCLQYPELVAARNEFEETLEKQAFQRAITPAADLKEKILSGISREDASGDQAKIITMNMPRNNNMLRYVAAAAVVLLLASAWFAYDFYNRNQQLELVNKDLEKRLNRTDSILNKIYDPNVTVINMMAMTPAAPSANIYWDTTSSNVYLVVKNMPKLASDKQYQLWSLLDGKPNSLGLFNGDEKVVLKMNNAQKADAFAITIEKKGNTGPPTLEQLQSMGKTKL